MHVRSLRAGAALGALLLQAALAACSGDSTSPLQVRADTIVVPALRVQLLAGDTTRLTARAVVDGADAPGTPIAWTSSDTTIATVDSIGVVRARRFGAVWAYATVGARRTRVSVEVAEQRLAYEGYGGGYPALYTLGLDGAAPTRVLPALMQAASPALSPDGATVLYVVPDYANGRADVYRVAAGGGTPVRLTPSDEIDDQPAWSPDGSRIAFRSFQAQHLGHIVVMNGDGTNVVDLTPDPLPGVVDNARPAWSPDGARIAYASYAGGNWDIWTMKADGSDRRQVTSTPDLDTEPAWSPDGRWIAFRRGQVGASDVCYIAADGAGFTMCLAMAGDQRFPAWSPDGKLISYTQYPDGDGLPQLYTTNASGSVKQLRTTDYLWGGGAQATWIVRRPNPLS